MDEKWLPVVGYEGLYEVSDLGRVWSVPRVVWRKNGTKQTVKGKMLSQFVREGYPRVTISKGGVYKAMHVHRLVLRAHRGECPPGKQSLNGRSGPMDPALTNLRWGTPAENAYDRSLQRDDTESYGERQGSHKLTTANVIDIRRRYVPHVVTEQMLGDEFGVTAAAISLIIRRVNWKQVA